MEETIEQADQINQNQAITEAIIDIVTEEPTVIEQYIVQEEQPKKKRGRPKSTTPKEPKVNKTNKPSKEKKEVKHMSREDIEWWDKLYEHVRSKIMGYSNEEGNKQALPSFMILRLKGLLENKFIVTHQIEDVSTYSYKTVLYTFKFCNPQIDYALSNIKFSNEQHKFNYIMKIVEPNIIDVHMRMKRTAELKESLNYADTSHLFDNMASKFNSSTLIEKNTNDRLKDLYDWM